MRLPLVNVRVAAPYEFSGRVSVAGGAYANIRHPAPPCAKSRFSRTHFVPSGAIARSTIPGVAPVPVVDHGQAPSVALGVAEPLVATGNASIRVWYATHTAPDSNAI